MAHAQQTPRSTVSISPLFIGIALAAALVAGLVAYQLGQGVSITAVNRSTGASAAVVESGEQWMAERTWLYAGAGVRPEIAESGAEWQLQREQQTPRGHVIDLSPTAPELR